MINLRDFFRKVREGRQEEVGRLDNIVNLIYDMWRDFNRRMDAMTAAQQEYAASEQRLASAIQDIAANQAKALADAKAAWEANDDAKWHAAHETLDGLTNQLTNVSAPPSDPGSQTTAAANSTSGTSPAPNDGPAGGTSN